VHKGTAIFFYSKSLRYFFRYKCRIH